ncbi:MAG: hypothetical protein WKF92_15235 [Pyrinomonadaceae bacterium]
MLAVSCSQVTDFFVVNNSTQPIDVVYRLKLSRHLTVDNTPGKIPKSQLRETWGSSILKLDTNQYRYDQATNRISVRLMPDEALWVTTVPGYSGHESKYEHFKIGFISITGGEGGVQFEGD